MIKHYTELMRLHTIQERFQFLKNMAHRNKVGEETFGGRRWINQNFYRSKEWRELRDTIIIRDQARDMAMEGHEIYDMIIVHHIDPVTQEDLDNNNPKLYDPENLICVTDRTHKAIHYGGSIDGHILEGRFPNDTIPWKVNKGENYETFSNDSTTDERIRNGGHREGKTTSNQRTR